MKPLSPSTRALLQAVLAPDVNPEAVARWQAATNIERLEPGQFQLLPLVYQQMAELGEEHPWLPRLKGIYRRTWFANQLALRAAAAALHVLTEAGQPTLLLGAAALALTVYADLATRPIDAAQVLTPTTARPAAIQALTAAGWQPAPATDALAAPRYERWQAGHLFVKPLTNKESLQVRLCWHALPLAPVTAWGAHWFDRATSLASESLQARTLDPTDQIFLSLAGGSALELTPLVDGRRLIAQHPIDWPRFVRLAVQSRLTHMVAERLALIQALGGLNLPNQVLTELQQTDAPGYVATAWRLDQVNPWERSGWQRLRLSYAGFRQRAAAQGIPPRPGAFYDYLRTQLGSESLSATFRRSLRRLTTPLPLPHGY